MKKLFYIFFLVAFLGCQDDGSEFDDLLPMVPVNQTIFLNNPESIDLQVVGGWAYAPGGVGGIVIYHAGTNNYLAFERSAPHLRPEACSKMTVKSNLIMHCSCDDSEFSLLSGAPLTDGVKYPARQYRVLNTGPNTLQITNF